MVGSISFGLSNITCQRYPGDPRTERDVYHEMLELTQEAERVGFDSIWCAEHHFLDDGYLPSPFVFFAAVAARTERLRFGTSILQAPLHNPLRIAEDAAVLDLVSDGRLTVGVGQGWRAEEFDGFGVPLRGRHRRLEEEVLTLRQAWSSGYVSAGSEPVSVTPKPARAGGPPVFIGASAEPAVRRAGRVADGFLASALGVNEALGLGPELTPARFAEHVRWIKEELEAANRDVGEFTFCVSLPTLVFDDEALWELARGYHYYTAWRYPQIATERRRRQSDEMPAITPAADAELRDCAMVGPPQLIVERIGAFAELVDGPFEFHARMIAPGLPIEVIRESMRRFSSEVIPAFR